MPPTILTGKYGENLAASYISSKGYIILERNFNNKFGELDIIAVKGKDLVFFEVKYRTNKKFGYGDESISKSKIEKLRKSIEVWISKKGSFIQHENVYLNAIVIDENKEIEEYEIL